MNLSDFFAQLKQRNVYKVGVAYAVVAWLLIQIATQVFPFLKIPDWAVRWIILALALGFPIALVIAWAFELTPEGIKRADAADTLPARRQGSAWIYVVLGSAALSVGLFFLGRYTASNKSSDAADSPLKSIAVLPFASLSEDRANAYFADGIQDEILTRLSKIADLKVISRTSTQQFQSKPGNLVEIAKQLGVAHILEGSVQKAGDSVRVNVQLIKAEGDSHLWAETYDRKLLDVFAVESEVAGRIAGSLEAKLTGREKQELARVSTKSSEAYEAYLHGLALDNSQSDEAVEEARKSFRRAVDLDPQFALAWAYLAGREAYKFFAGFRTPAQLAIARETMETATKFEPESSEAHFAAGTYYYYCLQDFERALEELKRARELSPSSANTIVLTALVKRRQGEMPASIRLQLEAAAVDPRNVDVWVNLGRSYRGQRNFQEAREMYDRALSIVPNEESVQAQKIETWTAEGDLDATTRALAPLEIKLGGRLFNNRLELTILRRDYEGAIAFIQQHLNDPAPAEVLQFARLARAYCQVLLGRLEEARPEMEKTLRDFEDRLQAGDRNAGLAESTIDIRAVLGDRAGVEQAAETLLRDAGHDRWQLSKAEESPARGYAILGDADRAIPHLERALSLPGLDSITRAYLRLDPVWDHIRDDARFQALAK